MGSHGGVHVAFILAEQLDMRSCGVAAFHMVALHIPALDGQNPHSATTSHACTGSYNLLPSSIEEHAGVSPARPPRSTVRAALAQLDFLIRAKLLQVLFCGVAVRGVRREGIGFGGAVFGLS